LRSSPIPFSSTCRPLATVVDARERAALDIVEAVYDGDISPLPTRGKELDAVPASLGIRLLVGALGAAAIVESALPVAIPRAMRRVTS
jgi:proline iminopeptidase